MAVFTVLATKGLLYSVSKEAKKASDCFNKGLVFIKKWRSAKDTNLAG